MNVALPQVDASIDEKGLISRIFETPMRLLAELRPTDARKRLTGRTSNNDVHLILNGACNTQRFEDGSGVFTNDIARNVMTKLVAAVAPLPEVQTVRSRRVLIDLDGCNGRETSTQETKRNATAASEQIHRTNWMSCLNTTQFISENTHGRSVGSASYLTRYQLLLHRKVGEVADINDHLPARAAQWPGVGRIPKIAGTTSSIAGERMGYGTTANLVLFRSAERPSPMHQA